MIEREMDLRGAKFLNFCEKLGLTIASALPNFIKDKSASTKR